MTLGWSEQLHKKITDTFGPKKGASVAQKYHDAFPASYQDSCTLKTALSDIQYIESLSTDHTLAIQFYMSEKTEHTLRLKLFQLGNPTPLSDVLPMLENMGLRTFSENPYKITLQDHSCIWISDFTVASAHHVTFDMQQVKPLFEEAFRQINVGACESDGFNQLIISAQLSWRDIVILRAVAKYIHQTGFRFSQPYIEKTLAHYPDVATDLVNLFKTKHDPAHFSSATKKQADEYNTRIQNALSAVASLDEDRILRRLWNVINSMLRTNYFQTASDGTFKNYFSFKLQSKDILELPLPHPLYEIFVYAPDFEAIHLRSAKVARGGIRWSDRLEDFRTEVLGLMKAQKVKNAVIVPSGAKGGFVLKKPFSPQATREQIQTEVIRCYQSFMRGLLDLTDNIKGKKTIRPTQVVCYDDEDPYLVVAADKGTASFSDIANGIAKEYHFWLGDAFASGGSVGYDHKKMGITARGAWESVKRHFLELGINVETTDFTMIGIGDMSGDVFGNGALYTPHIKLLGAFDHRHIFLDPNPDGTKSLTERLRLFNLPNSSWEDYNTKLISTGGGVFKRSSKSIPLSAQIKKILQVEENAMAPNDLIRALLKAPVDLLFNGGIGTYVKASTESHADAGDRTNEYCRINGEELRCRVVGEGGNLGFTQLGRVEYALTGGLINTDFIDNSAGVDCSDHEVNIKILLNHEMEKGTLTEVDRNKLLKKMTEEVGALVLQDNYRQALAMSIANTHAVEHLPVLQAYIKELEAAGELNRVVEFLPDDKKIVERKTAGKGLTRPELAVLLAYTKIHIQNELLKSDLPDDPYFFRFIDTAFPATLNKLYPTVLKEHRLRREIISTQLSNAVVNVLGISFIHRMQIETGASVSEILRAYTVVSEVYAGLKLETQIESLDFKIPLTKQFELLNYVRRLLHVSTRWFLKNGRLRQNSEKIISHYADAVQQLEKIIPTVIVGETKAYLTALEEQFIQGGLKKELAKRISLSRIIYAALNITELATENKFDLVKTAKVYFHVGKHFNLVWFRDQIGSDSREDYWDTLARLSLRDELDMLQRLLTTVIIRHDEKESNLDNLVTNWLKNRSRITQRWDKLLEMLHSSPSVDYVMFFIALRELTDLIREV